MLTADTDHVRTHTADGICRIEIHRPEKKNALTLAMYAALAKALGLAGTDHDVRLILLHGSDGLFTAGNDLGDFVQNPPQDEHSPVFLFLQALCTLEKPVLAAVSGPAIGIGTTMLLHCDLVYASPSARFQLPFVNLGLSPEAASSYLLPALMGHPRAAELLLFGEAFGAETAQKLGLINEVVPESRLMDFALERARVLAAKPAASLRLTKHLLKQNHQSCIQRTMRREAEHFVERLRSPEAAEAFQAFFEKREPDFSRFS